MNTIGEILIIEDNDDDMLLIKRGLKKGKIANPVHRSQNGQDGLKFLNQTDTTKIAFILLDLNMEVMNGFEFLQERQKNPEIKHIPVVVFTSSNRKNDIQKAYDLGANCYVEKPIIPAKFLESIMSIGNFWLYFSKRV